MSEQHCGPLLSAYADGQLDGEERAQVETHIANCEQCRREVETTSAVATFVRTLPMLEPPPGFFSTGFHALRHSKRALLLASAAAAVAFVIASAAVPESVRRSVRAQDLLSISPEAASRTWHPNSSVYTEVPTVGDEFNRTSPWQVTSLDAQRVAYAQYRNDDAYFTVFEHDAPMPSPMKHADVSHAEIAGKPVVIMESGNDRVVCWRRGDVVVSVAMRDIDPHVANQVMAELATSDRPELEQHVLHSSRRMIDALAGD